MKRFALAAIGLACLATAVQADPLDLGRVAADAKWMVHVDFAAVKRTELARYVAERWLALPGAQRSLAEAREKIGIDPIEDLLGLTFYGRNYHPEDGVVLIEATGKRDRLIEFLGRQSGYASTAYRSYTIHRWTESKAAGEHTLAGVTVGNRLLIVGRSEELVKQAVDVLDGVAPSLADGASPLCVDSPPGSCALAVATAFEETDAPFKSPVLRQSRRIALAMGEWQGTTFVRGEILARSEEAAQQIRTVIDGMIALVRMQLDEFPELRAALDPLEVTQTGEIVTARWEGGAKEAITRVEEAVEVLKKKP